MNLCKVLANNSIWTLVALLTYPTLCLSDAKPLLLRSLQGGESVTLASPAPTGPIFIVFQSECEACRTQIQDLKCLPQDKILLVGAFSTERRLRQEYLRMKTPLPAYYGDKDALKRLQITDPLTPQILIFGLRKNWRFKGLTPCSKIKQQYAVALTALDSN